MQDESNTKSWYLIYSKPGKEMSAKDNLERQNYKIYLPLIRNTRRRHLKTIALIEPLFPRYLFINLNKTTDNWSPIRSTIGVSKIVDFDHIPAQVPSSFVSTLISNEDKDGVQCLPGCGYEPGEKILINEGAMKGHQGIFYEKTGKERVTIFLQMLNQTSKLSIPADHIEHL